MIGLRAALFLAAAAWAGAAAAAPALVRVVVLDTSSSMAGERIDTAKKELLDLARNLPPTPDCPFVVIPFSDRVGHVKACADLKSFEDLVSGLRAHGGTMIASGLERALVELQRYPDCRHACVLLYTDGEDGDAAGITRQEERLDQLFAARQKRGLSQSVVFCKRWEQANAVLLKRVAERGHAKVLDGKELALRPVTLAPGLQFVRAAWAADQPLLLDVELTATLAAKGLPKGAALPGVQFACQTAGASGNVLADVPVDGMQAIRVRVPVPKTALKTIDIAFQVGGPQEVASKSELLLPLVAGDRVRVTVPLPARDGPFTLAAHAHVDGTPSWVDPLNRIARVPLRLEATAAPSSGQAWLGPVELAVGLPDGAKVVSGPRRIVLDGPKGLTTWLTVEGPLAPASNDRGTLDLTLTATAAPPGVAVLPAEAAVRVDVPWPAPAAVTIDVRTVAVSAARWLDLARAVGAFTVDLEVRVDGPLPEGSEVLVRAPPGVHAVRFDPAHVRPGTQPVRLAIEADLAAAQPRTFVLDVLPPTAPDTLSIAAPRPIRFEAVGPAAVRLVLSRGGSTPAVLMVASPRREIAQPLVVVPVVAGHADPATAGGLAVKLTAGGGLGLGDVDGPFKSNEAVELRVGLPRHLDASFFRDTVAEADLCVEPATPTPAVVGSRQRVRLRVEAPFKRFLFYGVGGASAAVGLYFLARTIRRFSTPLGPARPPRGGASARPPGC